ncbi:TetR family transcriptional regulator [Tsukamurella sp. NPDC003166]|uniref:TetR/AcrR family transcriptional regulator n=1 Tax=Tsukamurella sp. NPDC003166 TaxID=3154444 RepID=UPI0033BBC8C6
MANTGRTGRRPGKSDTRAEILAQARTLFAERGYPDTSVRAIAAAAGVDAALVHRFFGTKEQLFHACLVVPFDPTAMFHEIAAHGPDETSVRLVRGFLALWDSPETGPALTGFFRRALAEPETSAASRDFSSSAAVTTAAAARALLPGASEAEAQRRLSLVLSQIFGLLTTRRLLGIEPLTSWDADDLAAAVAPAITHYLYGELPPEKENDQ